MHKLYNSYDQRRVLRLENDPIGLVISLEGKLLDLQSVAVCSEKSLKIL